MKTPDQPERISICIPVYNGVKHISEAVESALAQDDPAFEVVVCDNASADGTREVLELLQSPLLRVEAFEEHVGMAANWNRAAAAATGSRVLLLSADDRLLPGSLASFRKAMSRYPCADLFIGLARFSREGASRVFERGHFRVEPGPIFDLESFVVGNPFPININAALFRRELVRFSENCGVVMDLELAIRLAQAGHLAVQLDEYIVLYRVHDMAASVDRMGMFRQSLAVYRDYLPQSSTPTLYRRRLFRTLFWAVVYLIDRGDRRLAKEISAEYHPLLSYSDGLLIRATLFLPWSVSMMERLRGLRAVIMGKKG